MNSSVKLGAGIIAALAIFALANSFFIVQMTQHAIVLRFGQVVRQRSASRASTSRCPSSRTW